MVLCICLGCMGFGGPDTHHPWTVGEEACTEIVKKALELGINFFDTAMGYGGGTSEEFLGKAVRFTASRKDIVLASKFLSPFKFFSWCAV